MSTTDLRKFFGSEVAFYRRQADMTQAQLADQIRYSIKTIQGIEQGLRAPSDDLARRLDAVFGLDGVLARLGGRARVDAPAFVDFRAFEQRAAAIYVYDALVVPGLLQTFDYALALASVMSPDADAKGDVADWMTRQERLRGDDPPELHVIIDESVLDRVIGGPDVFRAQLAKLLDPGPTVTVRILPHSVREHPGLLGSIHVLRLPDDDPIAFADSQSDAGLIDAPEAVARCTRRWDWLSTRALPVDVSADWIRTVMEDL